MPHLNYEMTKSTAKPNCTNAIGTFQSEALDRKWKRCRRVGTFSVKKLVDKIIDLNKVSDRTIIIKVDNKLRLNGYGFKGLLFPWSQFMPHSVV